MPNGSPGIEPLKVVLVHRYFAPDTPPYAHILRLIAGSLASRGHHVTVLTCQPSYRRMVVASAPARERFEGFDVVRWPVLDDRTSSIRKVANLLWFCLRLLVGRSRFRGADVVMAATTPPVILALVCSLIARSVGARFVYHKQDIYPEVISRNQLTLGHRILRRLDTSTDQRAARVVVLSEDMATTIRERGVASERIEVLNNFDPWDVDPAPSPSSFGQGTLKLVFAGNLGHFQGLDQVLSLMRTLADDPRIEFHFFGDGTRAGDIQAFSQCHAHVVMHGYRPAAEVAAFVRDQAHLGIVSLEPGVIRAAYPSKTMTYLRNGCPILALVEASELSVMVEQARAGLAGTVADLDTVALRLRELRNDVDLRGDARARARNLYDEHFAPARQLGRWVSLMESVGST